MFFSLDEAPENGGLGEPFNFIHVGFGGVFNFIHPGAGLRELVRLSASGSNGGLRRWRAMKKEHACIAYWIGRGFKQRRETVGADPLPDRLIDLLHKLRERDDLDNASPLRNRSSSVKDKI